MTDLATAQRARARAYEALRALERELADEDGRLRADQAHPETAARMSAQRAAVLAAERRELAAMADLAHGIAPRRGTHPDGGPRCTVCGNALGVGARSDAKFCSSACRGKAHRARGGRR